MRPPIDQKFVPYGGSTGFIATEIRGIVVNTDPGGLFIAIDPNYQHMCLPGDTIHPIDGEDGYSDYADADNLAPGRPIIKCETYAVAPWPGVDSNGPVMVKDAGNARELRLGDYVRVGGYYVHDCSHPIANSLWTPSFTVSRGIYQAGYPHTELHPYQVFDVALVEQLDLADQLAEYHTFVAPVFTEIYTTTWAANKVAGNAGNFVDETLDTMRTGQLTLQAGSPPSGAHSRVLELTDVVQVGWPPDITYQPVGGEGLLVSVSVQGSDLLNPTFYRARMAAAWHQTMQVSVSPSPVPLDESVRLTVTAVNSVDGSSIAEGQVVVASQGLAPVTGQLGAPINCTFKSIIGFTRDHHPVKLPPSAWISVTSPGYDEGGARPLF